MTVLSKRAHVLWWKDLERWVVPVQQHTARLPDDWSLIRIGELVKQVKDRVKVEVDREYKLAGVKWYGEGVFHRESVTGSDTSATYLTPLIPGTFIYNRLFAWKESFAVVPEELSGCFVSNEFPQFLVDGERLLAHYLYLFCMCKSTIRLVNKASIGSAAVSRNRFKEDIFLKLQVPVPPLLQQQNTVDYWQKNQIDIATAFEQAAQQETRITQYIYKALGVPGTVDSGLKPKYMILQWAELERWSFNYLNRSRQGLLGFHKSAYPIVPLSECLESTTNGYCIKPVAGPAPHKMLKLNALTPSGLDLSKSKYVHVPANIANRFSLRKDDLLICRSVGSYDHVAKCALVEEDKPDILFPDIIIRVRLLPTVLPQYVREVMLTPIGRSHFLSNARTAVGMWKVGAEDIRNFPLPLPPLSVQQEIVQRVMEMRAEIARIRDDAQLRADNCKTDIEAMILGVKMPFGNFTP